MSPRNLRFAAQSVRWGKDVWFRSIDLFLIACYVSLTNKHIRTYDFFLHTNACVSPLGILSAGRGSGRENQIVSSNRITPLRSRFDVWYTSNFSDVCSTVLSIFLPGFFGLNFTNIFPG